MASTPRFDRTASRPRLAADSQVMPACSFPQTRRIIGTAANQRGLAVGCLCLALSLLVSAAAQLRAATTDLPSPEALLQRHIEAIGGSAALRQAQTLVFNGEVSLPFLNAKAPIDFLFQSPDRFYCQFRYHHAFFGFLKVPFFAKRSAECGYDGTNGWIVDFERNVEPLYGTDQAFFRGLLDKFSPLCFSRKFQLARTLDVKRFAGRDCYRVLIVFPFGGHGFEFYDVKSGLLAGTSYPFDDEDAVMNVLVSYSDFRRVGPSLQLPFRIDAQVADQHYSIQASAVSTGIPDVRVPISKFKFARPPLPLLKPANISGREVIEKNLMACGGADALRKHTSLKLDGMYQMPGAHGFTNPVEVVCALPSRFSFTLSAPTGQYREGCDGEHYWRADGKNIRFAGGKDLEQKLVEREFLAELHAPEAYRSIETLGTINFDGHECYQLLLVRQNGEVFDEFYDVQTGLLRGRRTTDERTGGTLKLQAFFEDYRRFGDLMLATRHRYKLSGDPQGLVITNAQWDVALDSIFEMPADVKARLAQQK
jgi:hypothetical protein